MAKHFRELKDVEAAWATELMAALEANPTLGKLLNEKTVKRLAGFIQREYHTKRHAALNIVAINCGFANWREAQPVFVSNSTHAENQAKLERRLERRLRRKGRWAGHGDLVKRISRRLEKVTNLGNAAIIKGRGKARRA